MAIFVRNISTHTVEVELPGSKFLRLEPHQTCEVKSIDCKSSVFRRLVSRSVLEQYTSAQVKEREERQQSTRQELQRSIAKTKREAKKRINESKERTEKAKKAKKEAKKVVKAEKGSKKASKAKREKTK